VSTVPPPTLPFDIDAIERELARLWQSAPLTDRRNELALSRTSVLTLFVHAPDRERAEWARDIISRLSTHHPSRVVLLVAVPREYLTEPAISIQCNLGLAERYAPCYEQITITLPVDHLVLLPSILMALALPDLPAFLWWLGPLPCHERRFIPVTRAVDRLIFDSLESRHPLEDLIATRRLVQQISRTTAVSDLNWARLGPWQETTARMFDIEHCRWALEAITTVEVHYGHWPEHSVRNPTQALLYLGWLASRLGWRSTTVLPEGDGWAFSARAPDQRSIACTILPENCPQPFHGQLLRARFVAQHDRDAASFSIELSGQNGATVRLRAHDRNHCLLEHAFHHNLLEMQRLLIGELQETGPDWLYEQALDEATGFAVEIRKLAKT